MLFFQEFLLQDGKFHLKDTLHWNDDFVMQLTAAGVQTAHSEKGELPQPVLGFYSIQDTLIQVFPASPADIGCLSWLAAASEEKPSEESSRDYMVVS